MTEVKEVTAVAAERRLAEYAKFAKWCIRESAFSGLDLDGGAVQDMAEQYGFIVKEKYDRDKHGENVDFDDGEEIFVFSNELEAFHD